MECNRIIKNIDSEGRKKLSNIDYCIDKVIRKDDEVFLIGWAYKVGTKKVDIKVEGIAYRNPNNKLDKQTIPFLAYSTTETKTEIINNESDCKYEFNYTKAYLMVKTEQKNCDRFSGIYRLYD